MKNKTWGLVDSFFDRFSDTLEFSLLQDANVITRTNDSKNYTIFFTITLS